MALTVNIFHTLSKNRYYTFKIVVISVKETTTYHKNEDFENISIFILTWSDAFQKYVHGRVCGGGGGGYS